jgi:hypothetical protein
MYDYFRKNQHCHTKLKPQLSAQAATQMQTSDAIQLAKGNPMRRRESSQSKLTLPKQSVSR